MPRKTIQTVDEMKQDVSIKHLLYMKKLQTACALDQHADALLHQGAVNILEHMMIDLDMKVQLDKRRHDYEKLRNIRATTAP